MDLGLPAMALVGSGGPFRRWSLGGVLGHGVGAGVSSMGILASPFLSLFLVLCYHEAHWLPLPHASAMTDCATTGQKRQSQVDLPQEFRKLTKIE